MSKETREILEPLGDNGYHHKNGPRVDCYRCKQIAQAEVDLDALIAEKVVEAKKEQIMQDFMSLLLYDLTDFYENDLIEWREEQLAELTPPAEQAEKSQRTKLTKEMEGK